MPQGSLKASEYKRFRTLKERKLKMSVFRVERTGDYTVMSNHHLKNRALSLKAKGLLSLILSLPDDWDYTLRGLAYISLESVDSVRKAVTELENEGYITRTRTRDEQGRLRGTEYIIREQPCRKSRYRKNLYPKSLYWKIQHWINLRRQNLHWKIQRN